MSRTKQPHFVPQLILRNFTDAEGFLHCFDKQTNRFFASAPGNVFKQSGLYSQQVEVQLGRVEAPFDPIIKNVIRHAGRNVWRGMSEGETSALRAFLMIQLRRTPEVLEYHKQTLTQKVGRPLTPDEERAAAQALAASHFKKLTDEVEFAFNSKGVGAARVRNAQKALVIGSHPVAVSCPNGIPITHPEAAFHMPISPGISLGLHGGEADKVTLGFLSDRLVDRQNLDVLQRSRIIASHSAGLTESVAKMLSTPDYKEGT